MISNEILRDLNIKRTFIGVDQIQSYPIDMFKINILFNLENAAIEKLNKKEIERLIQQFLTAIRKVFKKNPNNILSLGFTPEYRIELEWSLPLFNFRFFILGNEILNKESELRRTVKQTFSTDLGGELTLSSKKIFNREDLFFELYPNTMMDEVLNLLYHNELDSFLSREVLELMTTPINIKKKHDFIRYYTR